MAFADRAADLGMNTAILTGYAFHMTPEAAARHEIWMKPMRPVELVAAIERCIGKDERDSARTAPRAKSIVENDVVSADTIG